jgi:hypothetical protein
MKWLYFFAALVLCQDGRAISFVDNANLNLLYSALVPTTQLAPDLRVSESSCFIDKRDSNEKTKRVEFRGGTVSLGQKFGCVVGFWTSRKRVLLRSELRGPGSLVSSSHPKADSVTYSEDGQSVFTELNVDPRKEFTGYWWSLDPADPRGEYEMRIWLEGNLIEEIRVISPQ